MKNLIFIISLIFPGFGHLFSKRYKTFAAGLIYTIFVFFALTVVIIPQFQDIAYFQTSGDYANEYTLGVKEFEDNSFMILLDAVFAMLFAFVLLFINSGFAYLARKSYIAYKSNDDSDSFRNVYNAVSHDIVPHAISVPAYTLILLFIIIPSVVGIFITFTNYRRPILPPGHLISWSGFDSFKLLFVDKRFEGLFESTIIWTVVWTLCTTLLVIFTGMILATIANHRKVRGKKFFRAIYLLPWAVPAFLTILIFKIFFSKLGLMNTFVLPLITNQEYSIATATPFLIDPTMAKITIILVQVWLGFPYIFTLTTGILQAIPDDLYEASAIDGGNPWTNFWDITFPIVMISAAPLLITQFTFTFNNVTIIYLLSDSVVKPIGANYGPLETIASLGFNLTIDADYATAAAVGLITSIFVSIFVLTSWIKSGAFSREEVM